MQMFIRLLSLRESHSGSIGWGKGQATPNNCAVLSRVSEEMGHGVAQIKAPL